MSHGLSARRARRTKSRGPKGLHLEVGARRAPRLLVTNKCKEEIKANQNVIADQKYQRDHSSNNGTILFNPESMIPLSDNSGTAYLAELDQKVKSMMKFSNNSVPGKARSRICNVCGKEGDYTAITNHIEANHLSGLPIPCHMCGTIAKTRAALRVHKGTYHKQ